MTEIPFYIGSYSVASPWAGAPRGHGAGITRAAIDLNSGLIEIGPHTAQLNPSFLARNDPQRRIWAIAESEFGGEALSYNEDAAGELTLGGRVVTGADAPCHIAVDWDRRLAFASHYHGGVLALLTLGESGEPQRSLSLVVPPAIVRGEDRGGVRSHVHASARLSNDEVLVTDTGRDLILLYRIVADRSAAMLRLQDALPLPAGTAPRHLALHAPTGAVYVSNQNAGGVSVVVRAASDDRPQTRVTRRRRVYGFRAGPVHTVGDRGPSQFRRGLYGEPQRRFDLHFQHRIRRTGISRYAAALMSWASIPAISG